MVTVRGLQEAVGEWADGKGWWETERNDGELIALMHSELSEALEALRQPDQTKNNVGEELADTVIRILDYCYHRNIDLEDELVKKMAYNEQRAYRHGGKRF